MEFYSGNPVNRLMPTDISRCDDFREIAPGLWYPFRVTELGIDWRIDAWSRDGSSSTGAATPRSSR